MLVQRTDWLSEFFGEVGSEDLGRVISAAADDSEIDAIVLDIDSPGGSVYGTSELGAKIAAAAAKKKCIAVADSMAASGAYWIASQASELCVTPGGEVGSIGVFVLHVDQSKALDEMGIKVTPVSAGKYKTAGNRFQPLSEEGLAQMQQVVDDYYTQFVKAVAKGRGVSQQKVRDGFGQGGMMRADAAVAEGMADRVCTLDDVLSRYGSAVAMIPGVSAHSVEPEKVAADAVGIRKRRLLLG